MTLLAVIFGHLSIINFLQKSIAYEKKDSAPRQVDFGPITLRVSVNLLRKLQAYDFHDHKKISDVQMVIILKI